MDSLFLSCRVSKRMALGLYTYITIMYLFPLLDWMGIFPFWSECIFPDGIYGWLIVAQMLIVWIIVA